MALTSLLVILGGFGHSAKKENNAVALANTPTWNNLWNHCPRTLIRSAGRAVGLPEGQAGNSEAGHLNLGSGRVVNQEIARIDKSIAEGDFANNPALLEIIQTIKRTGGALNIMGLLSKGGVHSHEEHIFGLIRAAAAEGIDKVYLHAFLDGRNTPPRSAINSLTKADELFKELQCGQVVTISGRYFAMDKNRNWDRLERAYNLIVRGEAPFHAENSVQAIEIAYHRGENDEFVQPTAIHSSINKPFRLCNEDAVVLMNFRADRSRQLARAMTEEKFDAFRRRSFLKPANFTTLTQYAEDLELPCIFTRPPLSNSLGEHLQNNGLRQLRIAETEKYADATFFFSGGREELFEGEERLLIPSPKVATYNLQPQMHAGKVTDELITALLSQRFDFIVCNYANCDMVGHSGQLEPAIKAVEALDSCLMRLTEALNDSNNQMLVTADHGNIEQMVDPISGGEHKANTNNPVPLVYLGPQDIGLRDGGALCDVGPTLLELMGLDKPIEMTGQSLIIGELP